jgi:hypothetical protein
VQSNDAACPAFAARHFGAMTAGMTDSINETIIETPDGPMTWAEWKKKNPVQVPSRRTKGKNLPNKIKRSTND